MNMQTSSSIAPPAPKSMAETGLSPVMLRDILLKTMFRMNLEYVSDISRIVCLSVPVTQEVIELCRSQKLVEATGTLHATSSKEMGFRLSDTGRARALDALGQSEYYGAMPVPLSGFEEQVQRQSIRNIKITANQLANAMSDLVINPELLGHLGPAVTSGRSVLFYGPPGNGKSSISQGIRTAVGDLVYVPRSVEYSGQVISVFDPVVHRAAEAEAEDGTALRRTGNRHDNRYVHCERPSVITGGELTIDMLDLGYNAISRTYTAPLQMKACGGIFIIDDLGRQSEPPQKLVNRWILPLERGIDILTLQSGEKFEVPFDTLVIFSTNFHPNEIFDQAALRRIFFKIKVAGPNQEDYLKVFAAAARRRGLPLDEKTLVYLMKEKYPTIQNNYANYQPLFLIDQMISVCEFEDIPHQMNPGLIDRAWANMFVREEVIQR